MKVFKFILIIVVLQNCSFDNKSGIWKNENNVKKGYFFEDFEKLSTTQDFFNIKIDLEKNYKFDLSKTIANKEWLDIFYNSSNNYENFKYENLKKLIFRSKKFTKHKIDKHKLYEKGNIIFSDDAGNLFIFSTNEKKIIKKFNFYRNKFKKIKKENKFFS